MNETRLRSGSRDPRILEESPFRTSRFSRTSTPILTSALLRKYIALIVSTACLFVSPFVLPGWGIAIVTFFWLVVLSVVSAHDDPSCSCHRGRRS